MAFTKTTGTLKSVGQFVKGRSSNLEMLEDTFDSVEEDRARLATAITKHGLHIASDKYCTQGLPLPFLTPDIRQKLIRDGINSHEVAKFSEKVGIQASTAILINIIIEMLHELYYDPQLDGAHDMYMCRTAKLISGANLISSGSNILVSALTQNIQMLDFGGFVVTLYRLISDYQFIEQVKDEFMARGFAEALLSECTYERSIIL